ncbi:kynurenine formamidase [Armigeres subalbatus]|uniref:kynurenine formamidase n=1 Tax=Armigeres subalbatus TaxID=124917 RepID=UPI002ED2FC61
MQLETYSSMVPDATLIKLWEKEYSPSEWSKRFPTATEVINFHVKFITEVSKKNRQELSCELDVEYGSGDSEKFDIYGANLPRDAPLFVYIHGGYWQMLSKTDSGYCAEPLVAKGYRVIVLDYELCPNITLEELVSQIKRAGEYILNYAGENHVKHISFAGHSAGAHLIAAMLDLSFATTVKDELQFIKHVYLISGVFRLDELRFTKEVNENNLLCLNDENIANLSPLNSDYRHLSNSGIKFHVYVAENDSAVFKQMSNDIHKHLDNCGITSSLQILPGLDHFDIVEKLSEKSHSITHAILENFES